MIKDTFDTEKIRSHLLRHTKTLGDNVAAEFVRRYVAAAPIDTGAMVHSAGFEEVVPGEVWRVFVDMPYAAYVEFGHKTVSGGWVPPNPTFRRTMRSIEKDMPAFVTTAFIVGA